MNLLEKGLTGLLLGYTLLTAGCGDKSKVGYNGVRYCDDNGGVCIVDARLGEARVPVMTLHKADGKINEVVGFETMNGKLITVTRAPARKVTINYDLENNTGKMP